MQVGNFLEKQKQRRNVIGNTQENHLHWQHLKNNRQRDHLLEKQQHTCSWVVGIELSEIVEVNTRRLEGLRKKRLNIQNSEFEDNRNK